MRLLTFIGNKYLGVIIHDKHQDDDMKYVKSIYSRGNMLISCFKTCSSSSKVQLFRSFFCNAYGCHLWSMYKQYTHKRVVVAFNIQKIVWYFKREEYVYNLCQ